jgi:hypothetical protein
VVTGSPAFAGDDTQTEAIISRRVLRRAATLTESFLDDGERGYRYGAAIGAANRPKAGSPDFP